MAGRKVRKDESLLYRNWAITWPQTAALPTLAPRLELPWVSGFGPGLEVDGGGALRHQQNGDLTDIRSASTIT